MAPTRSLLSQPRPSAMRRSLRTFRRLPTPAPCAARAPRPMRLRLPRESWSLVAVAARVTTPVAVPAVARSAAHQPGRAAPRASAALRPAATHSARARTFQSVAESRSMPVALAAATGAATLRWAITSVVVEGQAGLVPRHSLALTYAHPSARSTTRVCVPVMAASRSPAH